MTHLYLWGKEGLGEVEIDDWLDISTQHLLEYCVDTEYIDHDSRYGRFIRKGRRQSIYWEYIPVSEFPSEFRTTLLLLDIT